MTFATFASSVVNAVAAANSVAHPPSLYALNTWSVSGARPDTVVLSVPAGTAVAEHDAPGPVDGVVCL